VSDVSSDPAVDQWRTALGQSTSAQLRETQRERDEALRRAADLEQVRQELAQTKSTLDTFVEDNQRLESDRADLVDASLALKRALAASQQDLTRARGQVVDLLYIIDAFQIESGADRNASYATGIEAVRKLRQDLAEARQQNRILTAENESTLRRLNEVTP
jgi:exonuclease VII small subunit